MARPNVTNTLGIRLQLMIGPTPLVALPAPAAIIQAIDNIEISCDEDGSGFAITFAIRKNVLGEYTLLTSPLLTSSSRIVITIWLGVKGYTLMDGVVSHLQLRAGDQPCVGSGRSALSLKGISSVSDSLPK